MAMPDDRDFQQIRDRGTTPKVVDKQIHNFINGFPCADLDRPATPGDGIFSFTAQEISGLAEYFDRHIGEQKPVKFVPASGAASRMFKKLFEFIDKSEDDGSVKYLIDHIKEIAFVNELDLALVNSHGKGIDQFIAETEYRPVIECILAENGLNYASLPKGLLLFHSYPEGSRTAAEEHLVEAATYARDSAGVARIHFTISPEHRKKFLELFGKIKLKLEKTLKVSYEITLSEQKPSTDTIAVDEQNRPFRNPDGSLHFRPGGHGALLSNLNDTDGGIIFVKNIDNIVPDRLKPETYLYKKVLGGYLLQMKEKIHGFLAKTEQRSASEKDRSEMLDYMRSRLCMDVRPGSDLFTLLNRPMRVCGMVKNEGEPGGGPFWVRGGDGSVSLQIIESSQINEGNPQQKSVMAAVTHFNPVDLVCCIKDFRGATFDLSRFTDPSTGFITTKSSGGRILKAQELPGLWNGAMAKWITVFVEVPVITFNPVKTVNDLLRDEHKL
jgi:hypothetical protein